MTRKAPIQDRPSTLAEIMIGRGLAMSLHPYMAWRLLPPSRRGVLVFGYFAVAYFVVLTALQVIW